MASDSEISLSIALKSNRDNLKKKEVKMKVMKVLDNDEFEVAEGSTSAVVQFQYKPWGIYQNVSVGNSLRMCLFRSQEKIFTALFIVDQIPFKSFSYFPIKYAY